MTQEHTEQTEDQHVFYGTLEQEVLTAKTLHEAVMYTLEGLPAESLPETLTIAKYEHVPIRRIPGAVLDRVLEDLDEAYGDPNGPSTQPTEAMLEAEAAFLDVVEAGFSVWLCQVVSQEEVRVADYLEVSPDGTVWCWKS